jgi:pilus assembly protein CpaE
MRTLVVSANAADPVSTRLAELLRTMVDSQGPALAPFEEVERRLSHSRAEMVVVVLSPDPKRGLEALRLARQLMSGYVLAVGQASEPKLILRALHEGADHYLDEAELATGLEALLSRLQCKEEASAPNGRLVGLLGASGGSGASTLAVNVAATLAKDNERCALLDLKPGRGDLAALLDLKPAFNLADICLNVMRLDRAMFEKVLVPHPSGIHLLAAPQVFGSTRLVTTQGIAQALGMARRLFTNVVVDLEDCFHDEQLVALRQANVVLLVTRLDFTSLRNVRRILEHLDEADVPRARVRLVANRYGQPGELPATEAEDALGGKLAYYIPDDPKTVNGANNTGIPAVLKSPSAKVSQALAQLARGALDRRRSDTSRGGPVAAR